MTLRCAIFGHEWLTVYQTRLPEQRKVTTIHVCHRCAERQRIDTVVPAEDELGGSL